MLIKSQIPRGMWRLLAALLVAIAVLGIWFSTIRTQRTIAFPVNCPALPDDTSAPRWYNAAALSVPEVTDGGLLCIYRGNDPRPSKVLSFSGKAAAKLLADIANSQVTTRRISCPADNGDKAEIYFRRGARANSFTLRLTGCTALADDDHFEYADVQLLEAINDLAPGQAHPIAPTGAPVTASAS